jgi:hypothetical protein
MRPGERDIGSSTGRLTGTDDPSDTVEGSRGRPPTGESRRPNASSATEKFETGLSEEG